MSGREGFDALDAAIALAALCWVVVLAIATGQAGL